MYIVVCLAYELHIKIMFQDKSMNYVIMQVNKHDAYSENI